MPETLANEGLGVLGTVRNLNEAQDYKFCKDENHPND